MLIIDHQYLPSVRQIIDKGDPSMEAEDETPAAPSTGREVTLLCFTVLLGAELSTHTSLLLILVAASQDNGVA